MAEIQDVWRRMGTATRVMNLEIKKEIKKQNAIDTGRMKNVSRIVDLKWDDSKDDFDMTIRSTFYYIYVDEGKSRKYKNGRVNRDITNAFLKRQKVIDQQEKLFEVLFEYRIDQQFRK